MAGAEANRAFGAGAVYADEARAGGAKRLTEATQNNRFVNGRAFVQNGAQWVDTQAQAQKNAARRIAFASEEYFSLSQEHPEAAPWLALGKNLLLVVNGELLEIYE